MKRNDDFEIEMIEDEEEPTKIARKKTSKQNTQKKNKKSERTKGVDGSIKTKKLSRKKEMEGSLKREEMPTTPDKPSGKIARRMPISEGIKRRLLSNARDITRMKAEIRSYKKEIKGFENEVELLEMETEKVRTEKDDLEDQINKDKAIINAIEKKLNRTHKDFDGYKSRIEKEIERKSLLSLKSMILSLIEIMDNFDRTIQEGKKYESDGPLNNMINGMESIKKSYLKLLSDNKINIIVPVDEQFDPKFHEAISTINDTNRRDNTVTKVESNGYILDGVVLKPARVVVTKGGPPWPRKVKPERSSEDEFEDMDEMDELEEIDEE